MLQKDLFHELNFFNSINIGDYTIIKRYYIYDYQCEELVFGDGLLSDIFDVYLNNNNLHSDEPKEYIFDFFNDYEIEVR